jgi:hypothetical protein
MPGVLTFEEYIAASEEIAGKALTAWKMDDQWKIADLRKELVRVQSWVSMSEGLDTTTLEQLIWYKMGVDVFDLACNYEESSVEESSDDEESSVDDDDESRAAEARMIAGCCEQWGCEHCQPLNGVEDVDPAEGWSQGDLRDMLELFPDDLAVVESAV